MPGRSPHRAIRVIELARQQAPDERPEDRAARIVRLTDQLQRDAELPSRWDIAAVVVAWLVSLAAGCAVLWMLVSGLLLLGE